MAESPRVFISYSQDSPEHAERVLELANELRADGIDGWIDRFEPHPAQGWHRWMQEEITRASFVVLICTRVYRQKFEGRSDPEGAVWPGASGREVSWEGQILSQEVYDARGVNPRIVPVLFDGEPDAAVPLIMRAYTVYRLPDGYEMLYRRLTRQPEVVAGPIGPMRELGPRRLGAPKKTGAEGAGLAAISPRSAGMPEDLAPPEAPGSEVLRVLFLSAWSADPGGIGLDHELREITKKLRESEFRDLITWQQMTAVGLPDVIDGLSGYSPHVLHLTGHGRRDAILLTDDGDGARPVSGDTLAAVFEALEGSIRLVFLNACYSAEHARAIVRHVDFVVGMGWQINAEVASAFASSFYLALGFERSVEQAFKTARASLMLEGIPADSKPRLIVRPGTGSGHALLGPGARRARTAELAGPLVALPARLIKQLEPLRDRMHQGTNAVLPVIGSALCRPALPAWPEFIASLIDLAPDSLVGELRELLAKDRYLDIAELLEVEPEVGLSRVAELIRQQYRRPEATADVIYDLIAALPCTHVATTQYGPWLKEAIGRRHPAPRIYTPGDMDALTRLDPGSPPFVLMLHGDADRPEHCVLSQRSCRSLVSELPAYHTVLSALAAQRSFLFIGHAMNDPDILAVLEAWSDVFTAGGAAPRHYLLGVGLRAHDRLELARLGVKPIEYGKNGDTSLLSTVLHFLARNPALALGSPGGPGGPGTSPTSRAAKARRYQRALRRYAGWVSEHYAHLDMAGVGAGQLRLALDDIFVPLRVSDRGSQHDKPSQDPLSSWDLGMEIYQQRDVTLDEAFRCAAPASHLFILGDPGSGKTTALKKLMWWVISREPGNDGGRTGHVVSDDDLGFDGSPLGLSPDTVPVFIWLPSLSPGDLQQSLVELIDDRIAAIDDTNITRGLGRWLWDRGHLLLLLDGLDEVTDPERRAEVCKYLREELDDAFEQGKTGIRAAVSCRYAGLTARIGFGDGFAKLDIHPLDDRQIEQLTTRWFAAAESSMAERSNEDLQQAYQRGFRRGLELAETLRKDRKLATRRIKELVANPLLLTLLCVVVFHGRVMPQRRVEFFRDCLSMLLESWRQPPLLQLGDALSLLESLAWALHGQWRKDLFDHELRAILQPEIERLERKLGQGRRLTFGKVVDWLNLDTGVLARLSAKEYGFMHLSLQEYLCARYAAKRSHIGVTKLVETFGDPSWREVVLLFVASSEHALFGALMRRVLASDKLFEHEALLRECLDEAHELDTAAFAEIMESRDVSPDRQIAVMGLVRSRADERVRRAAAGIVERSEPGSDLREMAEQVAGTKRLIGRAIPGQPFQDSTSGMRFVWIAGGEFTMGADDLWEACGPAHRVQVSPFWLARTAVTNRQYELFLQATGYKEPRLWRNRRFNNPEQPVVGVAWMDARAFCGWLGELLHQRFELPTEAQWEFAARGPENRAYPWGERRPEESMADHGQDWDRGQPRPVACFPGSAGPFGTLDQAGSVWEWCLDEWDEDAYNARPDLTTDPLVGDTRQMDSLAYARTTVRGYRGGCWSNTARYLRSAFRNRHIAVGEFDYLGFRVACLPASDDE